MTCHVVCVIGQRGLGFRRLALRLEALSTQVQRLSRERDVTQLTRDDLSQLLQRYSTTSTVSTCKQNSRNTEVQMRLLVFVQTACLHSGFCSRFRLDQQGLAHLMERELKRVSQRLDQLSRHHHHQPHTQAPHDELRLHTGKDHLKKTCSLSSFTSAVLFYFWEVKSFYSLSWYTIKKILEALQMSFLFLKSIGHYGIFFV